MSYPPQGPHGDNPPGGAFGQRPDPYGQQPGQWQPPGYGQQGHDQGWGQQPWYGQAPYLRQDFGQFPQEPPRKRRTGLVLGLAGAGLLVVAGVVVLLVFTLGGGGAESVADDAVSALDNGDAGRLRQLTCSGGDLDVGKLRQRMPDARFDAARTGPVPETGDTATARVQLTVTGTERGKRRTTRGTAVLRLVTKNGDWCVRAIEAAKGSNAPGGPSPRQTPPGGGAAQRAGATAQRLADAVNSKDTGTALRTVCSSSRGVVQQAINRAVRAGQRVTSVRPKKVDQSLASYDVTVTGGYTDRGFIFVNPRRNCVSSAYFSIPKR